MDGKENKKAKEKFFENNRKVEISHVVRNDAKLLVRHFEDTRIS